MDLENLANEAIDQHRWKASFIFELSIEEVLGSSYTSGGVRGCQWHSTESKKFFFQNAAVNTKTKQISLKGSVIHKQLTVKC